jgi:hypothetical protein
MYSIIQIENTGFKVRGIYNNLNETKEKFNILNNLDNISHKFYIYDNVENKFIKLDKTIDKSKCCCHKLLLCIFNKLN